MTARWAFLAGSALLAACTAAPRLPEIEAITPAEGCRFVAVDLSQYSVWGFQYRLQVRADGTAMLERRNRGDASASHDSGRWTKHVGRVGVQRLDALCSLLDSESIHGLDDKYLDHTIDDAGWDLFVLRFPDAVNCVYVYGFAAPPAVRQLDTLLNTVVTETSWELWGGTDAAWLERCAWPPLDAWWSGQPTAYPPQFPD